MLRTKSVFNFQIEVLKILFFIIKNNRIFKIFKNEITAKYNCKSILIANGPSLKNDIHLLHNLIKDDSYDIYCVNNFAVSDLFFQIKPKFYFFADHIYWRDDLTKEFLLDREFIFNRILMADWPLIILSLPQAKNKLSKIFSNNDNIKVVSVDFTPINLSFIELYYLVFKFNIADIYNINSSTTLLWILLKKRYQFIGLFGVDFSSFKDISNNFSASSTKHFYENLHSESNCNNKYRKVESHKNLTYRFLQIHYGFRAFDIMSVISSRFNISVINYSSNSYVNNFKKYF